MYLMSALRLSPPGLVLSILLAMWVLSICSPTSFFAENPNLDGLFLMSQAGEEGGTALAQLFAGEAVPSGKLSDTWAKQYSDYPASETISGNDENVDVEYYSEGIFVGYRYFDTFGIEPAYPFGFGLSYTDFALSVEEITADEAKVMVSVKVTNTGSEYAGKEVVQVYYSAPSGALEKPYQELAAYAKTDVLAPGESQTLSIAFDTAQMASYSEELAAYVLEAGEYKIRVGNSSRDTLLAAVLTLDADVITDQLSNQMGDPADLVEISASGATSFSAEEGTDAKEIALSAASFATENHASANDEEKTITYLTEEAAESYTVRATEEIVTVEALENPTLLDVVQGKYPMETLVAQMDADQLAHIVNGISGSVGNETIVGAMAKSVEGGAGETTNFYYTLYGIPNVVLADGPAGVRITDQYEDEEGKQWYQYCSAWPVGTALAQTWNEELVGRVGEANGKEMADFGVTLWLAPGMNIHRDPICGRNFEYYSEDPYLTGTMGGSIALGVQINPGVGVTIKHYSGNNQENNRGRVNNWMSERAIREIYTKGFEIAIKMAQPMAIMTSYNKINGIYACENYDLLEDMARGEWGFDGMVMTDWGAGNRAAVAGMMHAGNDLVMPGGTQQRLITSLGTNPLDTDLILGDVQKCACRVLNMVTKSLQFGELYAEEGVQAQAYSMAYDNLKVYPEVEKSEVTAQ